VRPARPAPRRAHGLFPGEQRRALRRGMVRPV